MGDRVLRFLETWNKGVVTLTPKTHWMSLFRTLSQSGV